MRIVTDPDYCVKCHVIGDFQPQNVDRAKGPDLTEVYRRIRLDYLYRWLAKPTAVLPYTGMPVNIPYDPAKEHLGGIEQGLYHGTSEEQLDALVDLLVNYDAYARHHHSVRSQVEPTSARTDR